MFDVYLITWIDVCGKERVLMPEQVMRTARQLISSIMCKYLVVKYRNIICLEWSRQDGLIFPENQKLISVSGKGLLVKG